MSFPSPIHQCPLRACSAFTALLPGVAWKWHFTVPGVAPVASGSARQATRNGCRGELTMSRDGGIW